MPRRYTKVNRNNSNVSLTKTMTALSVQKQSFTKWINHSRSGYYRQPTFPRPESRTGPSRPKTAPGTIICP